MLNETARDRVFNILTWPLGLRRDHMGGRLVHTFRRRKAWEPQPLGDIPKVGEAKQPLSSNKDVVEKTDDRLVFTRLSS